MNGSGRMRAQRPGAGVLRSAAAAVADSVARLARVAGLVIVIPFAVLFCIGCILVMTVLMPMDEQ